MFIVSSKKMNFLIFFFIFCFNSNFINSTNQKRTVLQKRSINTVLKDYIDSLKNVTEFYSEDPEIYSEMLIL